MLLIPEKCREIDIQLYDIATKITSNGTTKHTDAIVIKFDAQEKIHVVWYMYWNLNFLMGCILEYLQEQYNTVYHVCMSSILLSTEFCTRMWHIKWKQLQEKFARHSLWLKSVDVAFLYYIYRCSSLQLKSCKIDTASNPPIPTTFIWFSILDFARSRGFFYMSWFLVVWNRPWWWYCKAHIEPLKHNMNHVLIIISSIWT